MQSVQRRIFCHVQELLPVSYTHLNLGVEEDSITMESSFKDDLKADSLDLFEICLLYTSWLKNAGSESSVEDQSDLTNIKNVKGDETFSENGRCV